MAEVETIEETIDYRALACVLQIKDKEARKKIALMSIQGTDKYLSSKSNSLFKGAVSIPDSHLKEFPKEVSIDQMSDFTSVDLRKELSKLREQISRPGRLWGWVMEIPLKKIQAVIKKGHSGIPQQVSVPEGLKQIIGLDSFNEIIESWIARYDKRRIDGKAIRMYENGNGVQIIIG